MGFLGIFGGRKKKQQGGLSQQEMDRMMDDAVSDIRADNAAAARPTYLQQRQSYDDAANRARDDALQMLQSGETAQRMSDMMRPAPMSPTPSMQQPSQPPAFTPRSSSAEPFQGYGFRRPTRRF